MTMKKFHRLLIAATVASASIRAGTELGNGVENFRYDEGHAWFLGNRVVKYCLVVSDKFGVRRDLLERETQNAIVTWKEYFAKKKIEMDVDRERQWPGSSEPYRERSQASRFELQACDGSEDLKIYFGVSAPEIQPYAHKMQDALGFAELVSYDRKQGWGKGFIWIAAQGHLEESYPDWSLPYAIEGILLHEFGHVLGARHQDGTIMSQEIATYFRKWKSGGFTDETRRVHLTQVDQLVELAECDGCSFDFVGDTKSLFLENHSPESVEGFELLTGRRPKDGVFRSAVSGTNGHGSSGMSSKVVQLVLEDGTGKFHFAVEPVSTVTILTLEKQFVIANPEPWQFMTPLTPSRGVAYMARLRTGRKDLDVIVTRNLPSVSVKNGIKTFSTSRFSIIHQNSEGKRLLLFEADIANP